jgi:hypothetical protein
MPAPKRLVPFVEGKGDEEAVPALLKRLLTQRRAWDVVSLDRPFTVGNVGRLVRQDGADWVRWLKAAARTRRPLGAVLLVMDGDVDRLLGKPFCPRDLGCYLSRRACEAGGGRTFSVASVFALREYESWLIAGVESLAGKLLPNGRAGVRAGVVPPGGDLEAMRDAKGWLNRQMASGYKPTTDQKPLTELADIDLIRRRNLRSFRRLASAVEQLVGAVRTGVHVATPAESSPKNPPAPDP